MAKISYELKDFSAGTITNGDLADIPDGAASFSTNISPTSKLGAAEPIKSHLEFMKNVPAITSMVVRDGLDRSHSNLAVNINSLFILIENYRSDTMLGDFVKIAEKGQLLANPDPSTWYSSGNFKWAVIDTIEGYGYDIIGAATTDGTLSTEGDVYMLPAATNEDGSYLADSNVAHLMNQVIPDDSFKFTNTKSFQHLQYAKSSKSVVILHSGSGANTTWADDFIAEFSKGPYLWGDLGVNLDLTETERGLFIGSATSEPHLQHKQADKDGDVFSYLVPAECKPPTAQNAISNIDQMIWVNNSVRGKADLMCTIYGQHKVWQLIQNSTTAPAVDYYEFSGCADFTASQKGIGGISQSVQDDMFWTWDFEGWNFYKVEKATDAHTAIDWALSSDTTISLKVQDVPDGGWIADIAESKCDLSTGTVAGIPKLVYVLFTRAGGLQEGDTILGSVPVADNDGNPLNGVQSVTPLYKVPSYVHCTAYTSHKNKRNWLGIKTDVNPTGPVDFYWPVEAEAKMVPYRNGGFADLTHYTKYGYVHDVGWCNTSKDKVVLDVGEGGLCVTTQMGSNHDCVWFNVHPLGDSAYIEYSGVWREAKQWPNLWFDTNSDGEWSDHCSDQNIVSSSAWLIAVVPQDIAETDGTISEFAMRGHPAEGPDIAEAWESTYDRLLIMESQLASLNITDSQRNQNTYLSNPDETVNISDASIESLEHAKACVNSSVWNEAKEGLAAYEQGSSLSSKLNSLITLFHQKTILVSTYDQYNDTYTSSWVDPLSNSRSSNSFSSSKPLNTLSAVRENYKQLKIQLDEVKDYAESKTISTYNVSQIRHIPIDTTFPIQKAFTQLQAYERGGESHFVGSILDAGVMKHADAVLTTDTSGTLLNRLRKTEFTWKNYYDEGSTPGTRTGDGGGGIFSAPVIDSETNEVQEATEGWALYKPDGANYVIPHQDDTNDDGNSNEGMLSSVYTGDLILKSYRYNNNAALQPIFDSGDIAIGLQVSEPSTPSTEAAEDIIFPVNKTYLYNMSFLYDGYQEGPLMATPVTVGPITDGGSGGLGFDTLDILVKVRNKNPRITHVQIYRKSQAAEKFRLVKSIAIDTDWVPVNPNLTLGQGSASMEMVNTVDFEFIDDGGSGISYEALTGMPETMNNTSVAYSESEPLGNYLFIANCRHIKLPDAKRMIFRSEPGKFSLFNWASSYLGMPENIHSLKAYNNRLYAFSHKTMYRIDPFNLTMETEFTGMGIGSAKSVCTMDGAMYIANKNGVYIYGGGKVRKISQTIDDRWAALWESYPSATIDLQVDKKYNSVLCLFDNAGTNSIDLAPTEVYAFTPQKNKWDIWEFPSRIKASCIDEDNELMICALSSDVVDFNANYEAQDNEENVISNPYSLYSLHQGTGYIPFKWVTKELTLGGDIRRKKIKSIKVVGKDVKLKSVTVDGIYKEFGATPADDTSGDSENFYQSWKMPSSSSGLWDRVGKNVKIEVIDTNEDADSTNEAVLRNISVIYSNKTLR